MDFMEVINDFSKFNVILINFVGIMYKVLFLNVVVMVIKWL